MGVVAVHRSPALARNDDAWRHHHGMRHHVDDLLAPYGGVATRTELLAVLTRNELDDEIARGHLVAPFPRAYCRPWDVEYAPTRDRAALASVAAPCALSHLTALRRYELPMPQTDDIHVTVPIGRHPIGRAPRLKVHRTRVPTRVEDISGLAVVEPAVAIVRSWPILATVDRRAPAIHAVRRRIVTPERLRGICERAVGMPGRAQLARLIDLLADGCESELEIWGCLGVFDVPGLRHGVRQRVVRIREASYRLDLAYDEERVAVEMDGDRWHCSRAQRDRDRRRDAALATADWLTLRFSWERLHFDVAGCRNDTLATLAARRAWRRCG